MAREDAKIAANWQKVKEQRECPQTYLKNSDPSDNVLHPTEEFKGPGKKSSIPGSITDANGQDTFWHDVNDHSYTDEAKKILDYTNARGIS